MLTLGPAALYPYTPFSLRTEPARQQRTRIILTVPTGWTQALCRGLAVLSSLADGLTHEEKKLTRQRRVATQCSQDRAVRRRILKAYLTLRRSGLLHREAIRQLVADPRFRSLEWSFSTFNMILPPASAYRPPARSLQIPPSRPLRLLRSVLETCDIHTFNRTPSFSSASSLKIGSPNGVSHRHPIPVNR